MSTLLPPIETPHGKLIRALLRGIEKARIDLIDHKPQHALVELEYAQLIANETLEDSRALRESFYTIAEPLQLTA